MRAEMVGQFLTLTKSFVALVAIKVFLFIRHQLMLV